MKKIIIFSFILFAFFTTKLQAQTHVHQLDSTSSISYSGFADVYYQYDFGNPNNQTRPGFVYSYNRHNEFTLNLGFVKVAYQTTNSRANIALMTGTYANANLAAEPGVLKNIYEANAGVKLSKKHNLWADAGVFASHIGFESAHAPSCWTLSRSILADNSPYYESGLKVGYTSKNNKWFVSGMVLNGWQRIQRPVGNNSPAFGHQLTWKPNDNIILNSSSFIGNDKPDSVKQMRYFHNFYGQFNITSKIGIIAGFDIGAEQKSKGNSKYNTWYAPVIIVKAKLNSKWTVAVRGEQYNDKNGVIIGTATPNGFQTTSYSINLDHLITTNVLWRTEFRGFNSKDAIFTDASNAATKQNYLAITSLAITF